jgi:hypothetical protein
MTYLHNQWDKLNVYSKDGQLKISNILAENAIRPFAIRRKGGYSVILSGVKSEKSSKEHHGLIDKIVDEWRERLRLLISSLCSR